MNIDLSDKGLTKVESLEIEKILARQTFSILDNLEQIWYLMDLIWDDYSCDNKNLNWDNIGEFYSHPIWLLNGLYIEQDNTSMGHRHVISDWVLKNKFTNIVDYGGGFGTLARLVAEKNTQATVNIYEPHPSNFGLKRANQFKNINMIETLENNYDCLLSTDVLEHVANPVHDFSKMVTSVKVGGYLIIANCFYPVIKCHLPQNFHLRYSFNLFAKIMGLKVEGVLDGSHATIFKKTKIIKNNRILLGTVFFLSKLLFPFIEFLKPSLKSLKQLFFK